MTGFPNWWHDTPVIYIVLVYSILAFAIGILLIPICRKLYEFLRSKYFMVSYHILVNKILTTSYGEDDLKFLSKTSFHCSLGGRIKNLDIAIRRMMDDISSLGDKIHNIDVRLSELEKRKRK